MTMTLAGCGAVWRWLVLSVDGTCHGMGTAQASERRGIDEDRRCPNNEQRARLGHTLDDQTAWLPTLLLLGSTNNNRYVPQTQTSQS